MTSLPPERALQAIRSVPKAGGTVVTLASSQPGPGDVTVDETALYWTNCCSSDWTLYPPIMMLAK